MNPDLSVIVPTLEDEEALSRLLGDLAAQRGVAVEVVVADAGGAEPAPAPASLSVRRLRCERGRGRQMNAGARAASAPDLLFLHADSRLEDPDALRRAKEAMDAARRAGAGEVAGHFGLRFVETRGHAAAYYFYEAKARTQRPDTVNGDQGFYLPRTFFEALGGFDERLPFLEDARLARRVAAQGRWILLPADIATSARRFTAEGFWRRQGLNALIRAFDALGRDAFFADAGRLYRAQAGARRLALSPFLALAHRCTLAGGAAQRLRFWEGAGAYARDNAWQLAFALDCRRNRRKGFPPGEGGLPILRVFDASFAPFSGKWGARLAAPLVFVGFTLLRILMARAEGAPENEPEEEP